MNKFIERIKGLFFGSIRKQITTIIIVNSFLLALILAIVFYTRASGIALSQLEESYISLATMVGSSSAYDIQFNKKAIPDLADKMVESDKNILWVEFVDSSSNVIGGKGTLGKSIVDQGLGDINSCMASCHNKTQEGTGKLASTQIVSTSVGKALLVVGVIQGKEEVIADNTEFGFSESKQTSTNSKRLGEVRMLIGLKALSQLQRSYLFLGFILLVIATIIGAIFAFTFSNYLMKSFKGPIELAQRISGGDLSEFKTSFEAKGELGELFSAFKSMSLQLALTIRRIRDAFTKVEMDTKSVRQQLLKTMDNTQEQAATTEEVTNNITSIEKSVKEVANHMEGLAGLAEEVSSSVLEMIASIEEIANNADLLTESVNTSASTLAQNTSAIKEIDASVEQINAFVEDTSSAMTEMETSIRQIEQNSSSMRQSVETASQEASGGVEVVEHTASTISQLQGSFMSVTEAMKNLGKRSEEIGEILSVIDDVMEQTHLLALNAAIIAAQAGEQGKAFSVVAGEIRGLAEKTSVSTREIATLIDTVQQEVSKAVDLVNSQNVFVQQTVKASEETATSFRRIQKSVQPAVMMTQEINRAIQEQTKGTTSVIKSVERLKDLAHQLGKATKEQSMGSDQILKAVNKMRLLAEEVKKATQEQSVGSSLIRKAMDRLTTSVASVLKLTSDQKKAAEGVEVSVRKFRDKSKENGALIKEASDKVEVLTQRAEEAGKEVGHFKIER
jgi:methyl-accepting chemotaxis protein